MTYSSEYLKNFICSNCHVGILENHSTLYQYYKCPICGFTKEVKKEKSAVDQIGNKDGNRKQN
jgi:DNA-directed RNA polymerase subunit RPC12/RpoP